MSLKSQRIVVVGAGVIGLTCALVLAKRGYKVSIVSETFPLDDKDAAQDYTSGRAGAHFRPFPSVSESDRRERDYTRETLREFERMAKEFPESSIRIIKGADWLETPSKGYQELDVTYSGGLSNFQDVSNDRSLPPGVKLACSYDAWVINAPMYVEFLQRRLGYTYGVEFKRAKLRSLKQVYSLYSDIGGIINATAFGLQYAGGYDPLTYPIRGHILVLRIPPDNRYVNETITHQGADGSWTYVINRPCDGGCILGGTKYIDDWDPEPREADKQSIIERARVLFPELFVKENPDGTKDVDFIKSVVGFRPARKGGSRVELERVDKKLLVHAYGIGGMGFEASFGMALHAAKLLEEGLLTKTQSSL